MIEEMTAPGWSAPSSWSHPNSAQAMNPPANVPGDAEQTRPPEADGVAARHQEPDHATDNHSTHAPSVDHQHNPSSARTGYPITASSTRRPHPVGDRAVSYV